MSSSLSSSSGSNTSNDRRRRSCKSENRVSVIASTTTTTTTNERGAGGKLGHGGQGHARPSDSFEIVSRSRSHQIGTDRFTATVHSAPVIIADETQAKARTLSSQQISEIGNILAKTKQEIHRKLNDLKAAAAIRVQLEG